jgi:hypothetical protein
VHLQGERTIAVVLLALEEEASCRITWQAELLPEETSNLAVALVQEVQRERNALGAVEDAREYDSVEDGHGLLSIEGSAS